MALNSTQKNIIDSLLNLLFESCSDPELPPETALVLLKATLVSGFVPQNYDQFKKLDMFGTVHEIQAILEHPCPQNRKVGALGLFEEQDEDGVIDGNVYCSLPGRGVFFERQGLLGLTAKNEPQTSSERCRASLP